MSERMPTDEEADTLIRNAWYCTDYVSSGNDGEERCLAEKWIFRPLSGTMHLDFTILTPSGYSALIRWLEKKRDELEKEAAK